jgi:hypothetical protein
VDDEVVGRDPSPDRAGGDVEAFRHLGDREEDLIAAVVATTERGECSRF